jgi:hypothetical protein
LRVGPDDAAIVEGVPPHLYGVVLSIHSSLISPNTAVLAVRLDNRNSTAQDVGVVIDLTFFFTEWTARQFRAFPVSAVSLSIRQISR